MRCEERNSDGAACVAIKKKMRTLCLSCVPNLRDAVRQDSHAEFCVSFATSYFQWWEYRNETEPNARGPLP